MSNTLLVLPGELSYCSGCYDVYGVLGGIGKRCGCGHSAGVPNLFTRGDFSTPFEICWYCQAEIIGSGSRWSTYFCDACRHVVLDLNDLLAKDGLVVLPIGRHSLMHARWSTARPFTTVDLVWEWRRTRLRENWELYAEPSGTDWALFSGSFRASRHALLSSDLDALAARVQQSWPDAWADQLGEVNARLHGGSGTGDVPAPTDTATDISSE